MKIEDLFIVLKIQDHLQYDRGYTLTHYITATILLDKFAMIFFSIVCDQ